MWRNIMNSNLFWCIIGIIGGAFFSLLISFVFYFKGLNRKRLTYDVKTFSIVSNKINQIEGLEVKYNSVDIENLYTSTITIKNIGNSIIRPQDLVPSCPISLSTSGQFLNAKMEVIESHPANKKTQYNLSFENKNKICNYVKVDFDYIPKKAVITYSIFHTGNINFNGDLMEGDVVTPSENQHRRKILNIIINILSIISGVLTTLLYSHFFN